MDTASIAASVIADMDGDSGGVVAGTQEPKATTAVEQPAEGDPDDFEKVPTERIDSLGRKRENAIPHSRVKSMIERRERQTIARVAKELGITKAEAELKLEDVLGTLTERNTKYGEFETRNQNFDMIEPIMEKEHDRFIQMLASTNPGYKPFADFISHRDKFNEWLKTGGQQQAQAVTDDPEPLPDMPLDPNQPNGPKQYSVEQLARARAWDRRQSRREAVAEMDGRIKPFEESQRALDEQRKNNERIATIQRQANEAVNQRLEKARKWVGFKENEAEILDWIGKNEGADFIDGYQAIYMPKLTTERTKIRDEVLTEINAAPRSTSTPRTGAPAQKQDKVKTTADLAREEVARFANA